MRSVLRLMTGALRLLYVPIRRLKIRKKVSIISRQDDEPTIDIRLLSSYMRSEHPDVECCVITARIGHGIGGYLSYIPNVIKQMYHISTSAAVVLDSYCIPASVLRHKEETVIIQMWHALGAIKKFGYQTIGAIDGRDADTAEMMCMHRNYDYVVCPSEKTGKAFCEAFDVTADRLAYMGLPRIDVIRDPDINGDRLRDRFGIPANKELLLYAPTFRKERPGPVRELAEVLDPERYSLVVRLHPLDRHKVDDIMAGLSHDLQIVVDDTFGIYEWFAACDRLITDYSALAIEFSLTEKPLHFFVSDIDEYRRRTGLNIDPENELPSATSRTGDELMRSLESPYDKDALAGFRDKYISVNMDNCTERIGAFICGMADN